MCPQTVHLEEEEEEQGERGKDGGEGGEGERESELEREGRSLNKLHLGQQNLSHLSGT